MSGQKDLPIFICAALWGIDSAFEACWRHDSNSGILISRCLLLVLLLVLVFSCVLDHDVKALIIFLILSIFTIAINAYYCVSQTLIFVRDACIVRVFALWLSNQGILLGRIHQITLLVHEWIELITEALVVFLNDPDCVHFRILKDLTTVFLRGFLIWEAIREHSVFRLLILFLPA